MTMFSKHNLKKKFKKKSFMEQKLQIFFVDY